MSLKLTAWLMLALILLAAIEAWWLVRSGRGYAWGEFWASLGDVAGRIVIIAVVKTGIVGLMLYAVWHWRIGEIAMDRWWHWALLLLGLDFCYYWMHRAEHRIRWFWLNHSVHHSSHRITFAAAYRLGWTSRIVGTPVFMAPLVLIGFPVPIVLATLSLNLLYQFWLHTELIGKLPRPIEYLFNTPSHHRAHHASNQIYIDRNYGGVLIVFDRWFGTFQAETAEHPPRYGLVEPFHSNNPFRLVAHAWRGMYRDLRAARGWRERAWVVVGPPEFKPAGQTSAANLNIATSGVDGAV
ncbi:sterol desaturase family protein [Luteimonas sp. SX5]|uniref:Sterol desaturase family protein n=1 Tax=Luteimonas galliterrae TaxID=2940486 RepID=A0ABT0MMH1_9GAMM|nr:sterol desaturase family protein [Luteimonas galliterrae]MCL1636086.1 sterol desaturase family protein [Luteimonas galliterrae]